MAGSLALHQLPHIEGFLFDPHFEIPRCRVSVTQVTMDGLSVAASAIAVVSLAMQATDALRELRGFISGFENTSEHIKTLLEETITLNTVLSEIAAADADSRALKNDTGRAEEALRAYKSAVELLHSLSKIKIGKETRSIGKGKEHAKIKLLRASELRQIEAALETLKLLCLVAQMNYSV